MWTEAPFAGNAELGIRVFDSEFALSSNTIKRSTNACDLPGKRAESIGIEVKCNDFRRQ
ncbi:MAG: hypothetical protein WCJ09_27300 [Planctomycetota bacterium]